MSVSASSGRITYWYEALPLHPGTVKMGESPKRTQGTLHASNERQARLQLRQQNLVPLKLVLMPANGKLMHSQSLWDSFVCQCVHPLQAHSHRREIITELAQCVAQQEMDLIDAIQSIEASAPTLAWQQGLLALRQHLLNGLPLAEILFQQVDLWGMQDATLLATGHAHGQLTTTLQAMANAYAIRQRHHVVFTYEKWLAGCVWITVVLVFAVLWWLPVQAQHPYWWQNLWFWSHDHVWLLFMTGLALVWLLCLGRKQLKHMLAWALATCSVTKPLWQWFQASRWLGCWQTTLSMQLGTLDSFRLLAGLVTNSRIKAMLGECLCRIEEGEPFYRSLDRLRDAPPRIARALSHLGHSDHLLPLVSELYKLSLHQQARWQHRGWALVQWLGILVLLVFWPLLIVYVH